MSKIEEKLELTNEENGELVKESNEEELQEIVTENEKEQEIEKDTMEDTIENLSEENKEVIENKTKETSKEENTATVLDENLEEKDKENIKKDVLHKYAIAITIISILLFIGLIVFSTVFALTNRSSNKIVEGVSIKGIDISGLTLDEAKEKIGQIYEEKIKQSITLKHNEYDTSLAPEQIEAKFGVEEAIDMAYGIGRSGKILKDNYAIINTRINKIDINPSFSYNEKILMDFIEATSENLPDTVKQSDYSIEDNKLIISKGQKGAVIKKEELKNIILEHIVDLNSDAQIIEIPVEIKEPEAIDIQKIHDEIYKEAKDAYYTKDPFTIYPHVDGVDFEISMDEARALLNNEEEEITIPLKITKPNVTTNQIGTEAFPDLLATYSTTFSTKNVNRTTNIKLASNKINGVVLMPNQQFSYNTVVGKRTAAAGYKPAAVYVGGKVEEGIGGGICQVSSTLYNTALRANLEIIKRSNHRFATGYVPLSTDATVSWGGPEFIFKNSRKYPIKIVSTVSGGKITVSIYGCKEDVEYEVVIKSETLQKIPMQTQYRTNTSLPKGTQKTVQKGHGGYKSRAYRILKLNGKVISTQLLSTDTYAQLPTIIEKN